MRDQLNRLLHDLRISVTDKCNFRCNYCMPEEVYGFSYKFLPRSSILTFEEIERLAKLYAQLGVRKIRITGGEPLLRQQVEHLIKALSAIQGINEIALTTNGYLLADKLDVLLAAGLNRLTISLDTLKPDRLRELAGQNLEHSEILRGIDAAISAGVSPIKINTVIQKGGNDDEMIAMADFARERGLIIRFIEFMDVGNLNSWQLGKVVTAAEIVTNISSVFPAKQVEKNYHSEVANRYRYIDGSGEFGVIASVSNPFCGACTRVRLSADGKLYTCLFGRRGLDIMTPMRAGASDTELLDLLTNNWKHRSDRYSEIRGLASSESQARKVEMYQIGG